MDNGKEHENYYNNGVTGLIFPNEIDGIRFSLETLNSKSDLPWNPGYEHQMLKTNFRKQPQTLNFSKLRIKVGRRLEQCGDGCQTTARNPSP